MSHERADAAALDHAAAVAASQQRNRARIVAYPPGGPRDVTEDVVTLLDAIHDSMDWGSGFLNREDLVAWKTLADLLGFDAAAVSSADEAIADLAREEQRKRDFAAEMARRQQTQTGI